MVLPVKQRIKLSHLAFVNADLLLPGSFGNQCVTLNVLPILKCLLSFKLNSIELFHGYCLLVIPELPSHILCPEKEILYAWKKWTNVVSPCNKFPLPSPIHEGSKLLNEVIKTLGALVEELVDKLAGLAEVRQLVEVAIILGVGGGDHLWERSSKIFGGKIDFYSPHPRLHQGRTVSSSPWYLMLHLIFASPDRSIWRAEWNVLSRGPETRSLTSLFNCLDTVSIV